MLMTSGVRAAAQRARAPSPRALATRIGADPRRQCLSESGTDDANHDDAEQESEGERGPKVLSALLGVTTAMTKAEQRPGGDIVYAGSGQRGGADGGLPQASLLVDPGQQRNAIPAAMLRG
jgi:hypothetical protein